MKLNFSPVLMIFALIFCSITGCTTSKNIAVNTPFTSHHPTISPSVSTTNAGDEPNLFDKLNISKKQFRNIVLSHVPAQFQNDDIDYHIITDRENYIVYIANEKIPPRPHLSLGNWTNSPLYIVELDSQ